MTSYLLHLTSNLLQIWKMTFLCNKHYMQGIIVAMAAKMPEVILTEYGIFDLWSNQHFLAHAPPTRPLLLLMDGHSTYYQPSVVSKAAKEKVLLFCLPPSHTFNLWIKGVLNLLKCSRIHTIKIRPSIFIWKNWSKIYLLVQPSSSKSSSDQTSCACIYWRRDGSTFSAEWRRAMTCRLMTGTASGWRFNVQIFPFPVIVALQSWRISSMLVSLDSVLPHSLRSSHPHLLHLHQSSLRIASMNLWLSRNIQPSFQSHFHPYPLWAHSNILHWSPSPQPVCLQYWKLEKPKRKTKKRKTRRHAERKSADWREWGSVQKRNYRHTKRR